MGRIFKAVSSKTGRPRKYTLESLAEVYSSGVSVAETGRLLGLHHTTVLYGLKQLGIERRKRSTVITDARRERSQQLQGERAARAIRNGEVCALYSKGLSVEEIAKRLGITTMVIYGVIRRHKLPARSAPRVCEPRLPVGPPEIKRKLVNYAEYREEWRDARLVDRMLGILDRRRTRLCA